MDPAARAAIDVFRAVDERMNVLSSMVEGQKSLTICVRYRDASVDEQLVRAVRECLTRLLEEHYPGQVSNRYGELAVGQCTLRIRAADSSKSPDMIITVDR